MCQRENVCVCTCVYAQDRALVCVQVLSQRVGDSILDRTSSGPYGLREVNQGSVGVGVRGVGG